MAPSVLFYQREVCGRGGVQVYSQMRLIIVKNREKSESQPAASLNFYTKGKQKMKSVGFKNVMPLARK